MNSNIQKQKPEDEIVAPKKNFIQRLFAGEESSTMLTIVIVIIGIVLLVLIGFLIYRKLPHKANDTDFSDTSDNIPNTLSGTPADSATSVVTTTDIPTAPTNGQ